MWSLHCSYVEECHSWETTDCGIGISNTMHEIIEINEKALNGSALAGEGEDWWNRFFQSQIFKKESAKF